MIEQVLPPNIFGVERFIEVMDFPLFPEEEPLVARAVASRRREFATARFCARAALAAVDHEPVAILAEPSGAPVWPAGVVGSITHSPGYRAAAVARTDHFAAVGIDAEPNEPLRGDVLRAVSSREERDSLAQLSKAEPTVRWDRLLFSAKESVFKAWFAWLRCELRSDDVEVNFDPVGGTFTAHLTNSQPSPPAPLPIMPSGRWLAQAGLLVTSIAMPQRSSE